MPFIAHVYELRTRLFYVAASVGIFAGGAWAIQKQLTHLILSPAGGQQFIYTSPGGGFDFQFRLCLYTGIAASIPVIVYQVLRYVNPLLRHETNRFLLLAAFWSSMLAGSGILFGYTLGLPAGLHFLLHNFSATKQIEALISIQSYMSFVLMYLLGTAMLFQIPLILIVINRIRPLPPATMLKQQRWLIVGSLILGAIISPTPDIRNQLIFGLPVIIMYNATVGFIWYKNRGLRRSPRITALLNQDAQLRAERLAKFTQARSELRLLHEPETDAATAAAPARNPAPRPQRYAAGFSRRSYIA